jgi:hypothetical protein
MHEERGTPIQRQVSTSEHPWNITDVSKYITKTRATRISDTVFFKHQYITNPEVSPETLVIQAAQRLTSALQGTISKESETAEALKKVSKLFTKIAAAKATRAKAKEQRSRLRTHPDA